MTSFLASALAQQRMTEILLKLLTSYLFANSFLAVVTRTAEAANLQKQPLLILAEDTFAERLRQRQQDGIEIVKHSEMSESHVIETLASGRTMVWIGMPDRLPRELWIGNFSPSDSPLMVRVAENSPLHLSEFPAMRAHVHSAFLKPPLEFLQHNIDEEIRAKFSPILESYDRFGQLVGYPGVVLTHFAPSLVGHRFHGAECFCFFFDDPTAAVGASTWDKLLRSIVRRFQAGLVTERCDTNFASYAPGERAQIRVRVRNRRNRAVAIDLRFYTWGPRQGEFAHATSMRRTIDANDTTEAVCDLLVPHASGLHRVRVEICQDEMQAESLSSTGAPTVVDRCETGFVVIPRPLDTPKILTIDGTNFCFDGNPAFSAGTHYFPSSSWWEWVWRDFDPISADRDFAGMRQAANRIVRVWSDPVLDESSLRAMDAAIFLAAEHGIVLDICVFNQWVEHLGYERENGEHVTFQFRHPRDFNLYSISLRNIARQREYVGVMAHRWRKAQNVIYNLANETYLKDPDVSQMDEEVQHWQEIPEQQGELRDTSLFRRWAMEMANAIREAGGQQPVFGGYLFSLSGGGDTYLANHDAPLISWHGYAPPAQVAAALQYFDPASSHRPLLLEEFGTRGWNDPVHYDAVVHRALGAGAASVMSYEWGVSRLAKEQCFEPLPIRQCLQGDPDPRWFTPAIEYARTSTSAEGVGIAPFASGFGYGSIYNGTPFPASAAQAVARLSIMARSLVRSPATCPVYVLVPSAQTALLPESLSLFEDLWRAGVEFGVWQEADVEQLPAEARTIICLGSLQEKSREVLNRRRNDGTEIFGRTDAWKVAKVLPRVTVHPAESVQVMLRNTTRGRLYACFAEKDCEGVVVDALGHQVRLDALPHCLVLADSTGIGLIEGGGEIIIDGKMYCNVSAGLAFLDANATSHLLDTNEIDVMVSQPTTLEFRWPICEIEVFTESCALPLVTIKPPKTSKLLDVDRELHRYRLRLRFQK